MIKHGHVFGVVRGTKLYGLLVAHYCLLKLFLLEEGVSLGLGFPGLLERGLHKTQHWTPSW